MARKKVRKRRARVSKLAPVSVVTPTQMEALDKMRMIPDMVKDMEKKKQDDRYKELTDSNTKLSREVEQLQQHSRQQSQEEATDHTGGATE